MAIIVLQTLERTNAEIKSRLNPRVAARIFFTTDPLRALGMLTSEVALRPKVQNVFVSSGAFYGYCKSWTVERLAEMVKSIDGTAWFFVCSGMTMKNLTADIDGFIYRGPHPTEWDQNDDPYGKVVRFLMVDFDHLNQVSPLEDLYQQLPWLKSDELALDE